MIRVLGTTGGSPRDYMTEGACDILIEYAYMSSKTCEVGDGKKKHNRK